MSGSFVYLICSLKATYLYYVIDQWVAEHPVQVYALILQNVLEEQEQIEKHWNNLNFFIRWDWSLFYDEARNQNFSFLFIFTDINGAVAGY